jgi:hypothetical protein
MITQEYLKSILSYDLNTGIFTWIDCRVRYEKNGTVAGTLNKTGDVAIKINGKRYKAHRLAWLYVYGEFPEKLIDHINGIRNDNKISNLRLANRFQNAQNSRKPLNNSSGFKGVSFHKNTGRWQCRIRVNNKEIHLGLYDTPELAHSAYCHASKKYHAEFGRVE